MSPTTRQTLLGSGTPNGSAVQSAGIGSVTSKIVLCTGVSVALPRPANRRPGASARSLRTTSGRTQSPPVGTTRTEDSRPRPTSTSISSHPGMKCSTVTRWVSISRAHASGSRRCASSTTTMAPPVRNVTNTSITEMSPSRVDRARHRSAGPISKWRPMNSTVFIAASWVTSTPFGSPVDPEVNNT